MLLDHKADKRVAPTKQKESFFFFFFTTTWFIRQQTMADRNDGRIVCCFFWIPTRVFDKASG
jgi:hypothetical protein